MTLTGLTIADLEAMPDDGRRYELIGGAIVMTPAPDLTHQRVSHRFLRQLAESWLEMEVFHAPVDLDLPGGQRVQPDLVVVEPGRTGPRLTLPVGLIVEIVSAGSGTHDRVTKAAAYAAAGVPHYWIIDPAAGTVTCLALEGGAYRTVAEGSVVEVEAPLRLRIDVSALIG